MTEHKKLREFAFTMSGAIAAVFGLVPWLGLHHGFRAWPWIMALGFAILGAAKPLVLSGFYRLWMALGRVLGAVNSRIILGVLFFAVFVPISLFQRVFGRDPLSRRFDKSATSYRIRRELREPSQGMKEPF